MKSMTERRLREVVTDTYRIEMNMPTDYPAIPARPTEEGGVRDRFMAAKAELPDEITVIRPFSTKGFDNEITTVVYIAEDGCDKAEGSKGAPLATLAEALKRVEGKGGAKIIFRGGNYNFKEGVHITKAHSGTEKSPLIITTEDGEKAYLSASEEIPASAFGPMTDEHMISRLKPEVRGKVLECCLPSLGITDYGEVSDTGTKLLIGSIPQPLCRYPNEGEELLHTTHDIYCVGWDDDLGGEQGPWEIGLTDTRCFDWEWHDDLFVFGALCLEWTRLCRRIGGFDKEKNSMKGVSYFDIHPVKYDPNNTYFFQNVFEELDAPGEWYIDRTTGKLYLLPPESGLENADIRLVVNSVDIITCFEAENVIFDGLDIGRCAGRTFKVDECRQVLIQRCHITGTCFGASGDTDEATVEILDGYRNGIIASTVEHFTNRAIAMGGGDRKNLIPSNNFVQNNLILNPHIRFGIGSGGCGNVVSHNYCHNTTMGDSGHNEGIFEYNVVEGGDTETHDTGMIYVGGGGLSSCANHYRYNYFFNFAMGDYGIYFDDLSRGMYAYGNIVVGNGTTGDGTTWESGGRGYNHHNGGEHVFYNNISIDAGYFAFGGDISYWIGRFDHWKGFFSSIYNSAMSMIDSEKYMDRNPTYKDFVVHVLQHHEDLMDPSYTEKSGFAERRLRTPYHNHYENNLIFRAARPYKLDNGEETATGLETNYITNEDPGFVDLEGRDYRFREDAEIFRHIPGFVPPPFEKMGPVDDYE